MTFLPFMGIQKNTYKRKLDDMKPTHRIRRNLDEAYCLLRQSEALISDLRQTIEHSWRLLERSYTIHGKNKRSSEEPELRNEDAFRENRRVPKILFISYVMNAQERYHFLPGLAAFNPAT